MIQRLGDLLQTALAHAGLEATHDLWRIGDLWVKTLGPTIAAHAAPVGLRRGELLVAAPEAVWRQELTFLGPDIKLKLNTALGEALVERVRIIAGPAFASEPPRRDRSARAEPAVGSADTPAVEPEDASQAALDQPHDRPREQAGTSGASSTSQTLREALAALERAAAAQTAERAARRRENGR